ncbi:C2 domain-containing protein [Cladophialophora immunda]|nr:C2 domain-containing protein [Cladophialophora immunda]
MASKSRALNAAHAAGIFADMTLDGPEIGTLVAVVDRAKNLPNRKTMGKQDPYCAMRLGKEAKKTETDKRGGQTPRWDQELRFTVHESPDYYKLKCSVFNDDKKTDLIGEAWIDLTEVIIPGGGQSDQWRQLNFKGKYAGDIRIELTYYDTRPKPEPLAEKQKQRDKSHSMASDAASIPSGPRQLGPRDIKRRPLPPGPGGHSGVPPTQTSGWPREELTDTFPGQGYTNSNPPPRPPKQRFVPETPDDVGYDLNPRFGPDSYEPPQNSGPPYHQDQSSGRYYDNYHDPIAGYGEQDPYVMDSYQQPGLLPQTQLPQPMSGPPPPDHHSSSVPHSPYDMPDQPLYHSSPPRMTPQGTPPATAQNQHWNSRGSTSPIKYAAYRDSPLRQSISPNDMPGATPPYADPRFDEDGSPPPPPAHRGTMTRVPAPSSNYRNSYGEPSPRTPVKANTVEGRSPLQRLERDYDPFQATPPSQDIQRQIPTPQSYEPSPPPPVDHDRYPMFPSDRRKSYNGDIHQLQPTCTENAPDQICDRNFAEQRDGENLLENFRRSTGNEPLRRAQTFDNFELHDERHVRRSAPVVVRPRPITPNSNHIIPRKSITPTFATSDDRNQMSSVPYGPGSYDVLNPGPSSTPVDGAFNSPEDALEVARQKEVDKLRDQGPIIGNDGRVIDPSDHLPSDTWAPEPERKQRKPEHVIRIRTREEARTHSRAGSSPASVRPHSIAASPYQVSPSAPVSSPYQAATPPATAPVSPQVEAPSGRNRLKKPMPNRALPTQPYPNAQAGPAATNNATTERPSPSNQRYTIHSSPGSGSPQRSPMSEYQVPPASSYNPRGGYGPPPGPQYQLEYSPSPANPPVERSMPENPGYGGGPSYDAENSLALELSRIDIGPSRMPRTALRPQKAYGAY